MGRIWLAILPVQPCSRGLFSRGPDPRNGRRTAGLVYRGRQDSGRIDPPRKSRLEGSAHDRQSNSLLGVADEVEGSGVTGARLRFQAGDRSVLHMTPATNLLQRRTD